LSILIYCIPGFLAFRNHNLSQGYHVFKLESLIWAVLGFFGIYVTYSPHSDTQVYILLSHQRYPSIHSAPKVHRRWARV